MLGSIYARHKLLMEGSRIGCLADKRSKQSRQRRKMRVQIDLLNLQWNILGSLPVSIGREECKEKRTKGVWADFYYNPLTN